MLRVIWLGWALVLFAAAQLGGEDLFRDGFETPKMYISTDRPTDASWALLGSSPSNDAVAVTAPALLADGKISSAFRFTWDTGAQTIANIVELQAGFAPRAVTTSQVWVLALFCPKTPYAIPAGVSVVLAMTDAAEIDAMQYQGVTVALNNGSTAIIGIGALSGGAFTAAKMTVIIKNNLGGSTWAAPGQNVDVGEVWFGTLREFKTTLDPSVQIMSSRVNRRSHSNQPWSRLGKQYKSWQAKFSPMTDVDAFDDTSAESFDSVSYAMAAAPCALFLPRIHVPGSSTIDPVALAQLACFGKVDALEALQGMPNARRWTAAMSFSEVAP